tara:strand:+ start:161 stop:367 length:207 start_codon:yes stop_codon:yes gene_type:complete
MKLIKSLIISLILLGSVFYPAHIASAVTCFKTGEQTSGMNKICYYDCMGSQAAITVSAVSLCPLTINN